MKKALFFPFQISLCAVGYLWTTASNVQAQVTPDGTVNTIVTPNGNVAEITGGETRDSNLFHSFQEFSVSTGNEAFFNNANDISNIFSRVTGGNISNIDGLIRANGSASLFLINPAGIIFGENASLSLGGSFYGSSASSILFENGEFSAADLENPPLLTVNAPIGLGFRDNPGDIVNSSIATDNRVPQLGEVGLLVSPTNTFALLGGDITFDGGIVTSLDGKVELGSVKGDGIVDINQSSEGFVFDYSNIEQFGNIELNQQAEIDILDFGNSSLQIQGNKLNMDNSQILVSNLGTEVGGEVLLKTTEAINFTNDSLLEVSPFDSGRGGNLTIDTGEFRIIDSRVQTSTVNTGNAGNLNINSELVEIIDGFLLADVQGGATGNGGQLNINASQLKVLESNSDSSISVISVANLGLGNGGELNIDAADSIEIKGGGQIISEVRTTDAIGSGGNININTAKLNIIDGGQISAGTLGEGNGGEVRINATEFIEIDGAGSGLFGDVGLEARGNGSNITIDTTKLSLINGGDISVKSLTQEQGENIGNAGNLTINASQLVEVGQGSFLTADVQEGATGNGGQININTDRLVVSDGGIVTASTSGTGDAGDITINATDFVEVSNFSTLRSDLGQGAEGEGGNLTIDTGNLFVSDGSIVSAFSQGIGNAGNLTISASDSVEVFAENTNIPGTLLTSVSAGATGNAGNLTIKTKRLVARDGAQINSTVIDGSQGQGGTLTVNATESIELSGTVTRSDGEEFGSGLSTATQGIGDGGDLTITTKELRIIDGAGLSVAAFETGDAGNLTINASESIELSGQSLVSAQSFGDGMGGEVTISTQNLSISEGSDLSVSTFGKGDAGNLTINPSNNASNLIVKISDEGSGIFANVNQGAIGDGGSITFNISQLKIDNGAEISSSTFGQGNAGNLTINASESVEISGSEVLAGAGVSASGQGGNLIIETNNLSLSDNASISAETRSGDDGGNITLSIAEDIFLSNNSFISARAFGEANGGNLDIDARFVTAFPSNGTGNDLVATADAGNGGNINLNAEQIFGLQERDAINEDNDFSDNSTNDIDASSNVDGLDGSVTITTLGFDVVQGARELPNNLVESEQTTAQACEANRELAAKNRLNITGKGGVPPAPDLPFDSLNVFINGESSNSISAIPQPIETSYGKIQPARGIKVTKDGGIVLTAYRTNNAGDRLTQGSTNCGGV